MEVVEERHEDSSDTPASLESVQKHVIAPEWCKAGRAGLAWACLS